MGKLRVFEIALSSQQGVYFAGQVLQGHVIIELDEPVKLKGIRITYRGRAFVHWTEQLMRGPGESRFREIRHHSATEEYFDVSQSLIPRGSGQNEDKKVLAPGQYSYPFQFELQGNLPSSFEGQHGFLRYWVKVTIEKPWKNDYSTKRVFTVICPMDLNREPSCANPLQVKKNKRLCCLCCTSGPVSALLCVQQKGYVPGEAIKITGEVNNMSSRKMGGSSVELKMTTVFHSTTKTRAVTQQVGKLKRGPIAAGDSDVWEGEKLVIPPLPPSFLLGCSIIDIKYIIELRVDPVGPAFDLSVPMNILIGTIPVRSAVQRYIRNKQISPPMDRFNSQFSSPIDRFTSQTSPSLERFNSQINQPVDRFNSPINQPLDRFNSQISSPIDRFNSQISPPADRFKSQINQPIDRFNSQINPPLDRFNQPITPPPDRFSQSTRPLPNLLLDRTNSPLGSMYSPHSPSSSGYSPSQPSSPGSVFSYGQSSGYDRSQGYSLLGTHSHFQGQGYGQHQGQGYGQHQGQGYGQYQGQGYGHQGQGYGQRQGYGQSLGYGQGRGYGQSQMQSLGYGYGQSDGYGYSQGYTPARSYQPSQSSPGQTAGSHIYPHIQTVESRQQYGAASRGACADVLTDGGWMPTPKFAEYFFGQHYVRDDDDEENTRGDMYYTPLYCYYDLEKQRTEGKPTKTVRIVS